MSKVFEAVHWFNCFIVDQDGVLIFLSFLFYIEMEVVTLTSLGEVCNRAIITQNRLVICEESKNVRVVGVFEVRVSKWWWVRGWCSHWCTACRQLCWAPVFAVSAGDVIVPLPKLLAICH